MQYTFDYFSPVPGLAKYKLAQQVKLWDISKYLVTFLVLRVLAPCNEQKGMRGITIKRTQLTKLQINGYCFHYLIPVSITFFAVLLNFELDLEQKGPFILIKSLEVGKNPCKRQVSYCKYWTSHYFLSKRQSLGGTVSECASSESILAMYIYTFV